MMRNPRLSVVTVSYNTYNCIEKTIQSVINQTYLNVEYLIIDGGSTDGTQQIIERYRDWIAYYVSERDKGLYDGMNKGIAAATGMELAALLAVGLLAAAEVVLSADDDHVFALDQSIGDFKGEGSVAALVNAHGLAVDPCFALVVNCAEVQHHALTGCLCGQGEGAAVPHGRHEIRVAHAGDIAFGAEGHVDGHIQRILFHQTAGAAGCAVINLELPLAVEVHPGRAHKLGTGIFTAGNVVHR